MQFSFLDYFVIIVHYYNMDWELEVQEMPATFGRTYQIIQGTYPMIEVNKCQDTWTWKYCEMPAIVEADAKRFLQQPVFDEILYQIELHYWLLAGNIKPA